MSKTAYWFESAVVIRAAGDVHRAIIDPDSPVSKITTRLVNVAFDDRGNIREIETRNSIYRRSPGHE